MATKKKEEYVSKAKTVEISAVSRVALKVRNDFFTIEAQERKTVPDVEGVDLDKEWQILFDHLNDIVDKQSADILGNIEER